MRVISGIARGRNLKGPKGMMVRPTSDLVKESLFNIIGPAVVDAQFLDLYAGTGGVGIEAISRGAAGATFVEKDRANVRIIRENLAICGFEGSARVVQGKVISVLNRLEGVYDLVFLDPPYGRGLLEETIRRVVSRRLLKPGGLLIAECESGEELPDFPGALDVLKQRRYGRTQLVFYTNIGGD